MSKALTDARVLGFAEALGVVLNHAAKVRVPDMERVALLDAEGRVLAEDVKADRDQPPFDRATRDGFAVRTGEWASGRRLRVAGQVRAGEVWSGGEMAAGCAVEIMTGAAVPRGADAVAMVEHVERAGDEVWAAAGRGVRAGENIVARGSEAQRGEVLLAAGTLVGAAEIAVAAVCGCAELEVRRRPVVAIVATGDELVELKETPGAYEIRNSNSYALAAMVAAGGEARRLKIARDTREELRERIGEAGECDLMLLSGGVSAGKYDLVEEVLAEFGAEFLFTGVRMQPGRPVVFGRVPRVSAPAEATSQRVSEATRRRRGVDVLFWVAGESGVDAGDVPLLRGADAAGDVRGGRSGGAAFVQAMLAEDVSAKAGLTRLLPARWTPDVERPEVRLVGWQGSGDLAANARANCYAVLPDGQELKAGDVITVLLR
jgi:molybdopterin molybdotransferase